MNLPGKSKLKIPWLLALVCLWIPMKHFGVDFAVSDWTGIALTLVAVGLGLVEIYKGADIGLRTFKYELATALVALVSMALYFALHLVPHRMVHIPDVVLAIMVVADAWFSPTIAYATALRNFAANVDSQ